ncbi:HAD-IIA family hydrolase [Cohnella rhizosphaerae]|uniref:Acid sugar phosphatase n=1 Tax=Cohnella rhizosphaerae TaxID=1457232 RepID=A0A9X4KX89_9BACL|nr:HAD-IIA family hydrolase [Cohnella rhizosphaerae]MDG0812989.1 HAD-IIA family hydrolase [Cohnella rhizosphaerae]
MSQPIAPLREERFVRRPKAVLLDLDGTLYRGETPIEGASALVEALESAGIACWYLTNNSTRTPEQVAAHLRGFGIPAGAGRVITSAAAAAHYAKQRHPDAIAFVIGEHGLRSALAEAGIAMPDESELAAGAKVDLVVQGLDRGLNYGQLTAALGYLLSGADYLLTNPDRRLPVGAGFLPGAGSLAALLETASDVAPVVIGKPSGIMMRYALDLAGVEASEAWVVGDNPHTDLAAGLAAGCPTVLVLTGVCGPDDWRERCERAGAMPDAVCAGPAEVGELAARSGNG